MEPVRLIIEVGGRRVVLRLDDHGQAREPAAPDEHTSVKESILRHATAVAVPVKVLARLCGYRHNSYFRAAVRKLVNAGRLVRTTAGVALPPALAGN